MRNKPLRCRGSSASTTRGTGASIGSDTLKAYLITTGLIFSLLALAHLLRTVAERPRLTADPWFLLEGPGIGVVAGALAFWAWRLLRRSARP